MAITKYTIDSVEYSAYASLDEANEYLRVDSRWTVWNAITDDVEKEIRLIQATREIDHAGKYSGTKMDASQPLEFPRMGLRCNGVPVTESLPEDIVEACILLAGSIAINPSSISPATTTATRLPIEIEAGPTRIRYPDASAAVVPENTLVIPDATADALIRCYFAGSESGGVATSISSGTDGESEFDQRSDRKYFIW